MCNLKNVFILLFFNSISSSQSKSRIFHCLDCLELFSLTGIFLFFLLSVLRLFSQHLLNFPCHLFCVFVSLSTFCDFKTLWCVLCQPYFSLSHWLVSSLILRIFQVYCDQCCEDPESVACAETTQGHQQSQRTEGYTHNTHRFSSYPRSTLTVIIFCFFTACSAMRVCSHQDHRQHRHRHNAPAVHVCLYRSTTLQGIEERAEAAVCSPSEMSPVMFLSVTVSFQQGKFFYCTDSSKQTQADCR